jgi:hypothetical protein
MPTISTIAPKTFCRPALSLTETVRALVVVECAALRIVVGGGVIRLVVKVDG